MDPPTQNAAKTLSDLLDGASFGGEVLIEQDMREEAVVEITKDVTIRGTKPGASKATLDLFSLVVRPLGCCVLENICIRAATPGFAEALVLAHCEELQLKDCTISGGYIGLLLAASSKVTMNNCEISNCLYAGVSVDCGQLNMLDCNLINNKVFGVVATAAVTKQDESSAYLENCVLSNNNTALNKASTPAPGAGVAALSGGWVFLRNGNKVSGFSSGLYVCGPRTLCHVQEGNQIVDNHVGLRLEQHACAHAAPRTIISNLIQDIQQVGPVSLYEDNGSLVAEQEKALSRSITMRTADANSIGGLRGGECGTGRLRSCFEVNPANHGSPTQNLLNANASRSCF